MSDPMPPQQVVDALAAMQKPCEGATLPTHPSWDTKCPVVGCACKGTGTVPAHPWLSEECPYQHGRSGCQNPLELALGPRCNGSGERVRRAETVTARMLREGCMAAGVTLQITIEASGSCEALCSPEGFNGQALADREGVGVGDDPIEAALRALLAAEQARKVAP